MPEQKGGSACRLFQVQTSPLGSSTPVMDQRVSRWKDDLHIHGLSKNLSERLKYLEEAFDDRSQTVGVQFPLLETTHLVELPEEPFLASGD